MLDILVLAAALSFSPENTETYMNACIGNINQTLSLPMRMNLCKCVLDRIDTTTQLKDIQTVTTGCAADMSKKLD